MKFASFEQDRTGGGGGGGGGTDPTHPEHPLTPHDDQPGWDPCPSEIDVNLKGTDLAFASTFLVQTNRPEAAVALEKGEVAHCTCDKGNCEGYINLRHDTEADEIVVLMHCVGQCDYSSTPPRSV